MSFSRRIAIPPTLPVNVHYRAKSDWLPFPLDQKDCRIFSLARHAIWNACHAFGLGEDDVVLVPAFHHGSEIEAFIQAGLKIRYYELNDMLEPEEEILEVLLSPEVRVLHIIHYWGFPQDAAKWRKWCDNQGILLFEDGAQAFQATRDGKPVGSFGHMGVFCFYKMYGVPDGGILISSAPPAKPSSSKKSGILRVIKKHCNWLAERFRPIGYLHLLFNPVLKWWNSKNFHPNDEFELQDPNMPPSAATIHLLSKIIDKRTAERRRENYRLLLDHFEKFVPYPFSVLQEGASPLVFPLQVNDPRAFIKKLKRFGIIGGLFWPTSHPSLPIEQFPQSMEWRKRIVTLPVHQELTKVELQQIISALHLVLSFEKEFSGTKKEKPVIA